jgi:hypothetical protein
MLTKHSGGQINNHRHEKAQKRAPIVTTMPSMRAHGLSTCTNCTLGLLLLGLHACRDSWSAKVRCKSLYIPLCAILRGHPKWTNHLQAHVGHGPGIVGKCRRRSVYLCQGRWQAKIGGGVEPGPMEKGSTLLPKFGFFCKQTMAFGNTSIAFQEAVRHAASPRLDPSR